jgi:hypothetical protein
MDALCVPITAGFKLNFQEITHEFFKRTNLNYKINPCNVQVVGEPLEGTLFVGSDVAFSLRAVTNSGVKTIMSNDNSFNDLVLEENVLHFLNDGFEYEYDTNEEKIIAREWKNAERCAKNGLVCKDEGIYVNNEYLIPALFPRDAIRLDGIIYIADTFSHRVTLFDEKLRMITKTIEIYYPNSLQISGKNLIVTSEHQNAIYSINLDKMVKKIIYGCGIEIYVDPNATVKRIQEHESSGFLRTDDGHSICKNKLYSPNHATVLENGDLLVCDTDDHRVLILDPSGNIKSEITNLNNPTRAVYVKKTNAFK